jgi:hypothetical protein
LPQRRSAIISPVSPERAVVFRPGDEVVLVEDGTHAIVRWSKEGYCAVNWLDEGPRRARGSVVAHERLRLVRATET